MNQPTRKVSYQWRLRELMAAHSIYATTGLIPLLHERGIDLSASQVHRLVTGTPERLSLQVLAALCDIFAVDPGDLIATSAVNTTRRKAANQAGPAPAELRPVRARILPADRQ